MKKKALRIVFSLMLSLFATILLFALGISHFAVNYICHPSLLLHTVEESDYIEQLKDEISYDWENLFSITGIHQTEGLMSILTSELVEKDAIRYIQNAYSSKTMLNTDALREQIIQKINNYISTQNIDTISKDELDENMNDLADACVEEYQNAIAIPLLPRILGTAGSISKKLSPIMVFATVGFILLFVIVFFLQVRRFNTLYYAGIPFITNGILLVGFSAISSYYNWIHRLPFSDSALKTLICGYLEALIDAFARYGYFCFIIGAVLLLIYLSISLATTFIRANRAKLLHTN